MEEKYQLREIRKEIFLTAYHGNVSAAHLASAYSVVEILFTLYFKIIFLLYIFFLLLYLFLFFFYCFNF